MVVLVPVPVEVIPPGLLIRVHVPVEGRPLITTLPVDDVHVGAVIVPIVGADGVTGCEFITILEDATDIQPTAFVTVYV